MIASWNKIEITTSQQQQKPLKQLAFAMIEISLELAKLSPNPNLM